MHRIPLTNLKISSYDFTSQDPLFKAIFLSSFSCINQELSSALSKRETLKSGWKGSEACVFSRYQKSEDIDSYQYWLIDWLNRPTRAKVFILIWLFLHGTRCLLYHQIIWAFWAIKWWLYQENIFSRSHSNGHLGIDLCDLITYRWEEYSEISGFLVLFLILSYLPCCLHENQGSVNRKGKMDTG